MKYFNLFTLMLLVSSTNGQSFITFTPAFNSVGLVQNIPIYKDLGLYAKYRSGIISKANFQANETSIGGGLSIPVEHGNILVGISHNNYSGVIDSSHYINLQKTKAISLNIGVFAPIPGTKHFKFIACTDVFNWTTEVGIGYSFSLNKLKNIDE